MLDSPAKFTGERVKDRAAWHDADQVLRRGAVHRPASGPADRVVQ